MPRGCYLANREIVCVITTWTAIDRLSIKWKSDLSNKIKLDFFWAVVVSILLYRCTTWMLTKCQEKKLDGNWIRMQWVILNKSWKQHDSKQQLYGHLPLIPKTIQVRWTIHVGHSWRSKDELISDILSVAPTHGCASAGRPARTYLQQPCTDTGCSLEDLPGAIDHRGRLRERIREIHANSGTWWWWWCSIWI